MLTPENVQELIDLAESYKPVVEKAIPLIMAMGTSARPIFERLAETQVDITDRVIKRYISLGYNKKEAMKLTMYNKLSLLDASKSINYKNG